MITLNKNNPLLTIFLVIATLTTFLLAGTLHARQQYLTRGIPTPIPPPANHPPPQLGLNIHLLNTPPETWPDTLTTIKTTGVTHLKHTFHHPLPNQPYDWTTTTNLITTITNHGFTLTPLLDGHPANNFTPPDPDTFALWTGQFATNYGHLLDNYIIWDEPNLTSHWGNQPANPPAYAALLTAASTTIRQADPTSFIIAAPLAPTEESGQNINEPQFLTGLYAAGAGDAFDAVAGKPYGFDTGPDDRRVNINTLNFSRLILLHEILATHNQAHKPVWAGNWGWISLPPNWDGSPSIWGQTDANTKATYTTDAFHRAQQEWPWAGILFLENWTPEAPPTDPRWGFAIANTPTAARLPDLTALPSAAPPGYHLASNDNPHQTYTGGWRFSPEFGADISQSGDRLTFDFWGTAVGLRVRRADYRARLYVTIDGQPANALPHDEHGAALILTAPDPLIDEMRLELLAQDLEPGPHTLEIVAERGWDQWALHGFSVSYQPDTHFLQQARLLLLLLSATLASATLYTARHAYWAPLLAPFNRLTHRTQIWLTPLTALIVGLTGWLTWGSYAAGIYRRLGDLPQLTLTASAATLFYVAPSFIIYLLALLLLGLLIYFTPAWGLVIIIFSLPFHVLPKPMLGYRFSATEIFILLTLAATTLHYLTRWRTDGRRPQLNLIRSDYAVLTFVTVATISLFFTENLAVATNEWRVIIIEPALVYLLYRLIQPTPKQMWLILDALIATGVTVALIGLFQYGAGLNLITAEGGLMRLRSVYGSPNNVALFFDRIIPLATAIVLLSGPPQRDQIRRWAYALALIPLLLADALTFSKGAIFLGLPAGLGLIGIVWLWQNGRSLLRWGLATLGLATLALLIALQIPALAARLNPQGVTSVFRLNLWGASLNMFLDHPWFGVGLDNFLYAYRGRYIFAAAWQEPHLNHPHNILLDFLTRLGLFGLFTAIWLHERLFRALYQAYHQRPSYHPLIWGLLASLAASLAHGLVDHSFFLVDLATIFYLYLAISITLKNNPSAENSDE
ncbi:MAG TPA: O-antigen ligase family protein [Anaerolineae bacterium]|nr:O-antigen ligase family protein [Anaerolineae bacterium]